jgi:membrane protein DedA with SNARE-associated domain
LRASVPIAAGMLGMPLRAFQVANFTSALVWVAVLLVPGDFTGIIWRWLRAVVGRLWT